MGILIFLAIAIAAFVTFLNIDMYESKARTNTLRELLASGKWEKANKETERLLDVTTNRAMGLPENQERKTISKYDYIPCSILRTIDELWVQYSHGRFGFSIQLDILEECKKADDWKKKEVQEFDSKFDGSRFGAFRGLAQSHFQRSSYSASLADPVEVVMLWERLGWITRGYTSDGRYTYLDRRSISDSELNLNYSLSSPKGHLPVYDGGTQLYRLFTLSILQRLKDCGHSVTSIPQAPSPYPQVPNIPLPGSSPLPGSYQIPGPYQPPGPYDGSL